MREALGPLARRRGVVLALAVLVTIPGLALAGENPLAPPDTSSPRATVLSFLARVEELARIAREDVHSSTRRARIAPKAIQLISCFDMRELAPSIAEEQCFEAAVLLKEVFDRVELADPHGYPDAEAAHKQDLERFRIPDTEICLVRVDSGPRKGEYLFSTETVEQAPQFFERVRSLPYHARATTRGLYELYVGLQGWLVPKAWIEALPGWTQVRISDHALWQWLSLAVFSTLGVALVALSYRLGRRGPLSDRAVGGVLRLGFPIAWIAVATTLDWIFSNQIRMTGTALMTLKVIFRLQLFLAGIVIALTVVNRVSNLVIRCQRLRPEGVDSQLVRLGFRVLTILVVAWIVVMAADYMGFAVAPLIAGLGVTGLAVALAAQHTVENLIGGIVLFADKPIRVGDLCRFGDAEGTIEQIGLRSTRVRATDRSLITIPNAEFAKLQLVNLSQRDRMLLKTVLQLRYETTADQLRYVLARLRDLLATHPAIADDPLRVRFVGYGAYSLDIEVFAYALTRQRADFLAIQEDLLLQVMDLVRDAGTGFAFPSAIEYAASDVGVDPDLAHRAELQVQTWRDQGLLASAGFRDEPAAAPGPAPAPTATPIAADLARSPLVRRDPASAPRPHGPLTLSPREATEGPSRR